MGIIFNIRQRLSNFFSKKVSTYIPINLGDGEVYYMQITDPKVALSFTAVYACIDVISGTIATLPCSIFTNDGEDKIKAKGHSLYKVLHRQVNSITTSTTFWETTLMHLLLLGNSYAEIIRDFKNEIKELHILNPCNMAVYKNTDGSIFYRYRKDGNIFDYPRERVLHISGKSFDGIVGLSPISLFSRTIATGIEEEKLTHKFFKSGARKIPIFSHPGKIPEEGKTSLKDSITDAWDNARPIMLEGGVALNTVTMNMTDAQLIESRVFSVLEIARIFRVPPHKIAELTHATFSNIEHQSMEFVRETILPWCVRIEKSIEMQLLSEDEEDNYFIRFNIEGLLRGDTVSRNQAYEVQFRNGIITREDWAKLEDLRTPKDEYSKDYYLTQQVRPIETAYQTENSLNENTNINKNQNENKTNVKEDDKNA